MEIEIHNPGIRFMGPCSAQHLPVRKGDRITIKAGVSIASTYKKTPDRICKRSYRVVVDHVIQGSRMPRSHDGNETIMDYTPPMVRWAGEKSYWNEVDMNLVPQALDQLPMLEEAERRLDLSVDKWKGHAREIAEAFLATGLVKGMVVSGKFLGTPHTWIALADGRVFDPMQWSLDKGRDPSIYIGVEGSAHHSESYVEVG